MKRTDPCLVVNGGLLGGGDRQGGISSLSLSLSPSSLLRPASLLLLLDYLHLFFSSSYLSSPLCRIYYHGTPGLLCEAVRSLSLSLSPLLQGCRSFLHPALLSSPSAVKHQTNTPTTPDPLLILLYPRRCSLAFLKVTRLSGFR